MKARDRSTAAACAETQGWLLMGGEAPGLRDRAQRHLSRCPGCQQVRTRLEQTRSDLQGAAPRLDDVRRARMHAQLAPALDELAARLAAQDARRAARPIWWPDWSTDWMARAIGRQGRRKVMLAAAAVALAGAGLLATRNRPADVPLAQEQTRAGGTAPGGPGRTPAQPDEAAVQLEPFRISGAGAVAGAPAARLLSGRFDQLVVPAGTTLRARLGRHARVTLIGPARLEVTAAQPQAIELQLGAGTLVADYDHRAGGRLRIRSPDGLTDVIGTLFSIQVERGHSQVAVSHGRVAVAATDGATRTLVAGEAWAIGGPAVQPVSAPVRTLFEAHTREAGSAAAAPEPPPPARSAVAEAGPERGTTASIPPRLAWAEPARPRATRSRPAPSTALVGPPAGPARVAPAAPVPLVPAITPAAGPPAPPPAPALAPPPLPPVPPAPALVTPAPAAVPPPPAPLTGEALYRAAEADMRRRDWRSAQQHLLQLIGAGHHDPIEDVARYELAQLALRSGDRTMAGRQIEDLLASDREPALREPAGFLRCELLAEAHDGPAARRCLERFRAQYPRSAHQPAALGWLIRLSTPDEACAAARGWLDEYLRRYPQGRDAALAAARRARCRP